MSTSSIDELLLGGNTAQQPMSVEEKFQETPEAVEEIEYEEPQELQEHEETPEPNESDPQEPSQEKEPRNDNLDEYGNEKEPENEAIRERLARQARKHQAEIESLRAQLAQNGASQEVQKAAQDFEYNPDASGDWQQQLAQFVKQTVNSMNQEQYEIKTRQEEARVQYEFESKFRDGMSRFDDFVDVIQALPCEISNPMTLATRSMENPAAFLYAAAKRQPQELERISKIRDPYAQMTEMGKLEERMRRNKITTNAPRPLGRTQEDATTKSSEKQKDTTGDDLLARADVKRLSTVKTRLRSNR
jgi:hypothetical protein